ncbi:hypothetical protein ACEQ8H_000016 [Pleosporales sp. CAS-2024a]
MKAIHRSRVRFRFRSRKTAKKDKKVQPEVKAPDQNKAMPCGQQHTESASFSQPQHEETVFEDDSTALKFQKQRVPSIGEAARSGKFASILSQGVSELKKTWPVSEECAIDDLYDSPPASLLLLEPVPKQTEHRNGPGVPEDVPEPENHPKTTRSPFSRIKTFVTNLTGHRKTIPKPDKNKQRADPTSSADPSTAPHFQNGGRVHFFPHDHYAYAPPRPSDAPRRRLTLVDCIPRSGRNEGADISKLPKLRWIPPAPPHETWGTGVYYPDCYPPEQIQRGFHVPGRAEQGPALQQKRRNISSGKLLDRPDDPWARWHEKYDDPETHPFAQQVPTSNWYDRPLY